MLFKTLYGPEIEAVYLWVNQFGPVSTGDLVNAFLGTRQENEPATINLEDTLHFLQTAGLIIKTEHRWSVVDQLQPYRFKTTLLKQLRKIQLVGEEHAVHPLDPQFFGFIDTLFIKPDFLFHQNLHILINDLCLPVPCSKEKVNAWKRILEYLDLGIRGFGGLYVLYGQNLLMDILQEWSESEGTLQHFMEDHFDQYLPWQNQSGDLAKVLSASLEVLEQAGQINLTTKQDLPGKRYLGARQVNWIARRDKHDPLSADNKS